MNRKRNQQLKIFGSILILTIVLVGVVLFQSASPMRKAKSQAVKISKNVAGISDVQDFYWFTRDKTYFTVVGTDNKNIEKIVFLPQDGSEAVIMNQKDGITNDEAIKKVLDMKKTKKINKVSLGIYKEKPVWEVVANSIESGLNYYLVDFQSGEIVNEINQV
ncbi:DUF5590 domain-containing protein [Vagococcus carniphilus]|uniref:cell wall elongation regulator TseB-like domain-containing protein n=1 Tax=Vagococcus carniphilus TaxID=218144 RepID=UPI002890AF1F|nr:DUF5590 domain-containing protein [Vagococcus carniphilus]MDT2849539.1 DUF5590 domain-containing protein [Vagococcus carniphilus]